MSPNLTAGLAAARYSDYLAAAERRRAAGAAPSSRRVRRVRSAWRGRRGAPSPLGQARAA